MKLSKEARELLGKMITWHIEWNKTDSEKLRNSRYSEMAKKILLDNNEDKIDLFREILAEACDHSPKLPDISEAALAELEEMVNSVPLMRSKEIIAFIDNIKDERAKR
ncbi:MAG: hypothetical protein IPJ03_17005 [Ignavibacteriales bacterium]|nr:hypothetical protein [Ignavibacteriales bacterium]